MDHSTPLIATIVGGLGLAFLFGALASRLRMSPIVGYLIAGVAVGPFTPGFVADQAIANELAEIGVILLMFGVGMHFSFRDLLAVRAIALPGAVVQIGAATLMGALLGRWMGWTWEAGIIFGLALSVASTVVLLRALEERGLVTSERGRIAVGWLIVEDIAMVFALVLLPALGDSIGRAGGDAHVRRMPRAIAAAVGVTVAKVAGFVAVMYVVGRRVIPRVLHAVAEERELFRLAVLAIALGVAFGAAKLFGVSFALGAFFAGMVLGESELSQRAAEESVPLREAFAVLFFVAVGHAVRPGRHGARAARAPRHAVHRPGRQVGCGLRHRAAVPPHRRRRHDDRGKPVADRRVLLHPRRPRRCNGTPARAGPRPRARGGNDLDRPQSVCLRADRAAAAHVHRPGRGGHALADRRTPHAGRLRARRFAGRGRARALRNAVRRDRG